MGISVLFRGTPLWALYVLTIPVILLSAEGGFRLAGRLNDSGKTAQSPTVGAMVGAILGLLALVLAFTFQMAASRFEARLRLVLDEANAVGTTALRAELLPEPHNTQTRSLLREYVHVRLKATQTGNVQEAIHRSQVLHTRLWSHAVSLSKENPASISTGLFVASLNELIDLHAKRLLAMRNRLPVVIWVVLYCFVILSLAAVGYQAGLGGKRSPFVLFALAVVFSTTMFLIADLDRSREGTLRVSQQSLIDLQNSMSPPASELGGTVR